MSDELENVLDTGYRPRKPQKLIHQSVKNNRFNVVVAHRRMGKTVSAINQLIHSALKCDKKNPRFAYVAPTYSQAKRIAWEYLLEYTRPLGGVANVAELRVDFMGRRINLYGADNPDSLRGIYLDGIVIDEIGDVSPNLFTEVVRPALADRIGYALFIGTPKGANHFKELRDRADSGKQKEWKLLEFKASQTNLLDANELLSAKQEMGDSKYEQEFECSFDSPIVGSYYGEIIASIDKQNHIRSIPHDELCKCYTAWDLGMSDSTSIWVVQTIGGEVRVLDYYEDHGKSLDDYVGWIKDNGYEGYEHILPHDVVVRELGTGKSRQELLESAGLEITIAPKLPVEDGIQAVRRMLPNTFFNEDTTKYGLECLRNYRRQFNDKLNVYIEKPLHDWSSHAADAFRYLAVGMDTLAVKSDWSKPLASTYKEQYT
jgi:phage terminase large subunit